MANWNRVHALGPFAYTDLTLDLLMQDNRRIVPRIPFAGWWGKYRSTDFLPIVIQPDGKVDFGSGEETDQNDRFGNTDIQSIEIREGLEFVFSNGEEDFRMKISSITDLTDDPPRRV